MRAIAINSGPPPKPNARRRNTRPARERLPAEGRAGPPPEWPLPPNLDQLARLEIAEETIAHLGDADDLGPKEQAKLDRAKHAAVVLRHKIRLVNEAEQKVWAELWSTPQAVAWERLRWIRDVAQYVRWKVDAEWGNLAAAKEARQLSDRLGLTPMSMLRLQWDIVADEVSEKRQEVQSTSKRSPSARLKVVADDAVEGTGTSR